MTGSKGGACSGAMLMVLVIIQHFAIPTAFVYNCATPFMAQVIKVLFQIKAPLPD